jgi:hypothetical protein
MYLWKESLKSDGQQSDISNTSYLSLQIIEHKPVSRHTTLEIMRCLATDNCDVYRKKSVVMVPFMFDELDSMRLPLPIMKHAVLPLLMLLNSDDILGVGWGGWMYVIIGRHFVPFECKFLLISEVIVRITLNVIVRQMPLNVRCVHRSKTCQTLKNFDNIISTCCEIVVEVFESLTTNFWRMDTSLFSGHLGAFDVLLHLM